MEANVIMGVWFFGNDESKGRNIELPFVCNKCSQRQKSPLSLLR